VINARLYLKEHFSVLEHVMYDIVSASLILFYSFLKFPGTIIETYLLLIFFSSFLCGGEDRYRTFGIKSEAREDQEIHFLISSLTWKLVI
jgi:hypothetical protein